MAPPLFAPIDWRLIRDTLFDWVRYVSGCEVIWADQSAPQAAYPYASLNILPGTLDSGALDEERRQPDGTLVIVGPRDFILSCQIHVGGNAASDPACDARMRADALNASLGIPQFQYSLRAANLGLRQRGQVQMLDLVVGTQWIKRAQVDIRFGTMSQVDVNNWPNLAEVGWFDKVSVSSDIQGLTGSGGLNWTDEVLDPNA